MSSYFEMDTQQCSHIFESLVKRFPNNRIYNVGDRLFEPGEDWFFYLVIQGSFSILRSPTIGEKKEIGRAYRGGFLGEWILFGNNLKEVEAIALEPNTTVVIISIDQMNHFRQEDPIMFSELLRSIAKITNERLRLSSFELAMIYEASEKIANFSRETSGGVTHIIAFLCKFFHADLAALIEYHEADKRLLFSRTIISHQDVNTKMTRVECAPSATSPLAYKDISIDGYTLPPHGVIIPLWLDEQIRGYCLLGKQSSDFPINEKRIFFNIAPLLTSACIIEQQRRESKDIEHRHETITPICTDNSYL